LLAAAQARFLSVRPHKAFSTRGRNDDHCSTGALVLLVLAALAVTTSAVFAEKQFRPEPDNANCWDHQSLDLGDTGFVAAVGPWGTENPVHYSVAVHERHPDATESVCFDAKLHVAGLPKGFTKKPIKEVVRFDPASRLVTFDLGGGQEARYKLPAR
jgi:hypothetical protein